MKGAWMQLHRAMKEQLRTTRSADLSVGGRWQNPLLDREGVSVFEPGWVHLGRCDGNEIDLVANAVMESAVLL